MTPGPERVNDSGRAGRSYSIDVDGVDWRIEACRYDRIHHRLRRVAARLNRLPGVSSVLDLGCAGGKLETLLRPGIRYYGCDVVPELLAGRDPRRFGVWNAERDPLEALPFDQSRFDALVISGLLEHVEDREQMVARLPRLLAEAGYVILTYANPRFLLYRTGHAVQSRDSNWIARLLRTEEIQWLFEAHGLKLWRRYHLSFVCFYPAIRPLAGLLDWATNQYVYLFRRG